MCTITKPLAAAKSYILYSEKSLAINNSTTLDIYTSNIYIHIYNEEIFALAQIVLKLI